MAKYISKGGESVDDFKQVEEWKDKHFYSADLYRILNVASGGIVPERRLIEGKVWDCSMNLKQFNCKQERQVEHELDILYAKQFGAKIIPYKHATVYILPPGVMKKLYRAPKMLAQEQARLLSITID